eukprot:CAMPEP_0198591522 /NCGR_PEP_ID=MMETSP1462-20131121/137015_1 /TAXON_ID=1333877 /ORGANISM="Brandtodinium nutriculum, Strain RCC3387" /LENGTH=30 /DNA_ID= /DNA_START= /DNA_END= /DNA_ORIENTATION=
MTPAIGMAMPPIWCMPMAPGMAICCCEAPG